MYVQCKYSVVAFFARGAFLKNSHNQDKFLIERVILAEILVFHIISDFAHKVDSLLIFLCRTI
jgi:hypothetical protein